jgi:hypothetical protein
MKSIQEPSVIAICDAMIIAGSPILVDKRKIGTVIKPVAGLYVSPLKFSSSIF